VPAWPSFAALSPESKFVLGDEVSVRVRLPVGGGERFGAGFIFYIDTIDLYFKFEVYEVTENAMATPGFDW
jgi:hypothetical protein